MENIHLVNFINLLPSDVDAALVFDRANRYYLSGVDTDDAGTMIITRNSAYFIIDSRYIEVVSNNANDGINIVLQKDLYAQINDILSNENAKTICIEKNIISISQYEAIKSKLSCKIELNADCGKIISKLRMCKTSFEIDKIKTAQKITDKAFEYILGKIEEGKSEKELALELEFYMRSHGANAVSFDVIFIAGANTSMPHGVPSDYKLKKGDFVTMDFGADYLGYKSDMTRTVALGNVSDEQKSVYNIVLEAQKRAIDNITVGAICSDIDKIARDYIKDTGYGEYFGHALGHSVGLQIHETPTFSPKCSDILKSGMILSVEPGIYIPQKFGVRIEDLVLIGENCAENLTKSDKSLIIL